MTLILTKVGQHGLVMAADSAITDRLGEQQRALNGARKLFIHNNSKAMLGIWGAAVLPALGDAKQRVPTEFVLEKFVKDFANEKSVENLCDRLAEVLQDGHGSGKAVLGIDVAACSLVAGVRVPAIRRVANMDSPYSDLPIKHFYVQTVRPEKAFDPEFDRFPTLSGDDEAKYWFQAFMDPLQELGAATDRPYFGDTLADQRDYAALVIQLVASIYARTGKKISTVGGSIMSVSIGYADGEIRSS